MVAEGGVFSPSIALIGDRGVGRKIGVSLPKSLVFGVGVPDRGVSLSVDLVSWSKLGVRGIRSEGLSGEPLLSVKLLRSFILPLPFWKDCIRFWYWPLINDFSGDRVGEGFVM